MTVAWFRGLGEVQVWADGRCDARDGDYFAPGPLSREADQKQAMNRLIVRGFHEIPGFVAGLWTFDRDASQSVIIHTFDSLSAAAAFAEVSQ